MGLKVDWEEALQNKQLAGVSDIVGGIHPNKPQKKKKVRERNGVSEALTPTSVQQSEHPAFHSMSEKKNPQKHPTKR